MNPRRIITYTPAASVDLVLLWYIGHYVIYYTDIINKNLKWFNSTSISLSNSSCTFLSSKKWLSAWGVHLLLQIKTCFHSFRQWRNTNILNLHWKNNHWASLPVLWRRFKKKKKSNKLKHFWLLNLPGVQHIWWSSNHRPSCVIGLHKNKRCRNTWATEKQLKILLCTFSFWKMGKLRGPIWNIKHSDGPDQKNNYSVRCLLSNTSYSSFISLSLSYLPLFYFFFLHTLQIFLVFHNQAEEIRHVQLPHLF